LIEKAAFGQIPKEVAHPEPPRWRLVGRRDTVREGAQAWRGNRYDVSDLVRKALAQGVAVLYGREHRAEEKNEAIGILVVGADRLSGDVGWIPADEPERRHAFKTEVVFAGDD
jgi:hypothetical protein